MPNDKLEITFEDELELLEPEDGIFVSRPPTKEEMEPKE
jgi:hypothetical protein